MPKTETKKLASVDNYAKPLIDLYILDIESKPQESLIFICQDEITPSKVLKDPEKIAADIEAKKLGLKKKMSVDPDFADIICIGIKRVGAEKALYTPEEMETFFAEIPEARFISFNGKDFDLPLLIKTGIKRGLKYPYKRLKDMTIKWRDNGHTDLMELICDKDYKSLDLLLKIYLGISKTPIDFNTATEEEIKTHCLEDLDNTEALYNKFRELIN